MWLSAYFTLCHPLFSQYQTLGPNSCGLGQNNCHASENGWWIGDNHYGTTDKFYAGTPSLKKVSSNYGLTLAQTYAGDSKCMTCHGTIISGKENQDIDIGVSCESCHGAGSGYKDPHAEGDSTLGIKRPGYIKGLQLGMTENKNLVTRAQTCSRCHNITEAKLITAGHPDGMDFDYIRGMRKVSAHWKHPVEDAGQLRMAFASVLSSAPDRLAASSSLAISTTPKRDSVIAPVVTALRTELIQPSPRIDRPAFIPAPQPQSIKTLPPFPFIPDGLSDYEKAVILKRHIDLLLKFYQNNK